MIVSGGHQTDSAMRINLSIFLQTALPPRLPPNTEQSSLCYTVGPSWLSILNIAVCTCRSQTPYLSPALILTFWRPEVCSKSGILANLLK